MRPLPYTEGMLSIVVPLYREEANVAPLVEKLEEVCKSLGHPYELIIVDDGSDDGTAQALENLKAAHPNLKPVYHRRNYGQSAALTAGFDAAQGEWIATMDGDLQNDPADIPAMLKMVENGEADVVCGWRQKRKDNAALVKIPSLIGNFFIRGMTGVKMRDYGCALRIFHSEFAKGLTLYGELHRFIPVLVSQLGARLKEVPVRHHPREHGRSKYNVGKAPRVFLDLLLMFFFQKFATRPIQFFGGWGLGSFGAGMLMLLELLMEKLMGHEVGRRPMLIIAALLVMVGVMLISIGLCAELIVRTYYESTGKKIYTTKIKP
jgi:glycosyltransferase involved in cell wall biosynthesis